MLNRDGESGMRYLALFALLFFSSVSIADNVIVGAFGQTLGAVVDEKLEFVEETSTGALKYKFKLTGLRVRCLHRNFY